MKTNWARRIWMLTVCFLLTAPAWANWHLYPAGCTGGTATVEIPCGAFGHFLIGQITAPPEPGCGEREHGEEGVLVAYPPTPVATLFPFRAPRIRDITGHVAPAPEPLTASRRTLGSTATASAAPTAISAPAPAPAPAPQPFPPVRWIAALDFDTPHGESTTWLAGKVAGSDVTATLVPLNGPDVPVGGMVRDLHVLAGLCAVAEVVHDEDLPVPLTVNMSFGRPWRDGVDPLSASDCSPSPHVACLVARVAHHLQDLGATLVAAAGNHGEMLFPARLEEVVSAGMLDLTVLFETGERRAAWETPATGVEAWIPGNGLCLGGWAAPAGSSYSSAMLAGWLVRVLDHRDVIPTLGDGPWIPGYVPLRGWVLGKPNKLTNWSNAFVNTLFQGLNGASATGCWNVTSGPTLSAPAVVRAHPPEDLDSLDAHGVPTAPAPESDPCVPCSGVFLSSPAGFDMHLDLSESEALPDRTVLDEVALRVDENYYRLSLTPEQLREMSIGELATIVIPDAGYLIPFGASASLWYRMKDDEGIDCEMVGNSCFWSSTPLLIKK